MKRYKIIENKYPNRVYWTVKYRLWLFFWRTVQHCFYTAYGTKYCHDRSFSSYNSALRYCTDCNKASDMKAVKKVFFPD